MKQWIVTHRELSGVIGVVVALSVALIYLFVIPETPTDAGVVQRFVSRYGHSMCWVLIAAASGLWAVRGGAAKRAIVVLLYMALAVYLTYIVILLI